VENKSAAMNDALKRGTLALVGSGEYLPPMEPVDRLLLDRVGGAPRVVCLPTAAGREGAESVSKWSRLGMEHFTRLGAQVEAVEVIDRRTADDDSLAERIRAANFVYLSGGLPAYLHKSLAGTKAWAAITGVLENGGVVAGCSAGAMIFGSHTFTFPTLWPLRPVFHVVPGVVMPHYDEIGKNLRRVIKFAVGRRTLVGVEGNTALVCNDSTYTVVGARGVTVWSGARQLRHTDGESVLLL
jgi:cyanophycinase